MPARVYSAQCAHRLARAVSRVTVLEALEGRQLFAADFTLQLLHASDFEASLSAIDDAPRFAAVVDALEETFSNTIRLSSGDNYLPSPFFNAGGDPALDSVLKTDPAGASAASIGRADIEILNRIGIQASTIGNHEFDAGPREFRNIFAVAGNWKGAQFPYLSSNLNFAPEPDLNGAAFNAAPGLEASSVKGKLTKSAVITVNGEKIGIVGATTPLLESISTTGLVGVSPAVDSDLAALAAIIQAEVNALRDGQGIDKIIVATHLQQISFEQTLAPLLEDVDVVIAGGSDTILADSGDRLRSGDVAAGSYPILSTDKNGKPLAIVNTDGQHTYVGRLLLSFDVNGVLEDYDGNGATPFFDPAISGAFATDAQGVTDVYNTFNPGHGPFDAGTKGAAVKQVTDAIAGVINSKDSIHFGQTDVGLEGRRIAVRTQETNFGNLSADANLSEAKDADPTVVASFKNGGGIRDSIGSIDAATGNLLPPIANPAAGKSAGDISQLDIENSLRFNNTLTMLTVNAEQIKILLEHGVAGTAPGATPGQFPQIGGIEFSFDPAGTAQVMAGNAGTGVATVTTAGTRIKNAAVVDENGNVLDVLVQNGAVVGDPTRPVRLVTLNFLVDDPDNDGRGGDNYPFASFDVDRVNLTLPAGGPIGEQAALGEYLTEKFPIGGSAAFNQPETAPAGDTRIQDLSARGDTVLPPTVSIADASVVEGNSGTRPITFNVTLSAASHRTVTVNYATADGFSIVGSDYIAKSGTVTFAPGETRKTVSVLVKGDRLSEPGNFFLVNLSNAKNAILADNQAKGTIIDDDTPRITINDKSIREGNNGVKTLAFTISLDRVTTSVVKVKFSTQNIAASAGSDYIAKSGTITFQPGKKFANVVITIKGDTFKEGNETFGLNLFNATNATIADPFGIGTIQNDD